MGREVSRKGSVEIARCGVGCVRGVVRGNTRAMCRIVRHTGNHT